MNYWVDELYEKAGDGQSTPILIAVVASKTDCIEQQEVPVKTANAFAKKVNAHLFQTSAKDGTGINEMFQQIAEKLYLQELA